MGRKRDVKKVKRLVRKLHRAVDKGEENQLQRDFSDRERAQKGLNRALEVAEALKAAQTEHVPGEREIEIEGEQHEL